jgi:hypothetical protein
MTDEECVRNVGRAVAYEPTSGKPEHGLIERLSAAGTVFVRYPSGVKCTYTRDLRLMS